jgi:hypothetical protein
VTIVYPSPSVGQKVNPSSQAPGRSAVVEIPFGKLGRREPTRRIHASFPARLRDDQLPDADLYGSSRKRGLHVRLSDASHLRGLERSGQPDRERCPASLTVAVCSDRALVRLHDVAHDRES